MNTDNTTKYEVISPNSLKTELTEYCFKDQQPFATATLSLNSDAAHQRYFRIGDDVGLVPRAAQYSACHPNRPCSPTTLNGVRYDLTPLSRSYNHSLSRSRRPLLSKSLTRHQRLSPCDHVRFPSANYISGMRLPSVWLHLFPPVRSSSSLFPSSLSCCRAGLFILLTSPLCSL